jgi:hypothetical protein
LSPRPGPADETRAGSIEELRIEITALKELNAAQQKQIDEQREQINVLLRLACSLTNEPTVCRP